MKVGLIGAVNVGKSTLFNRLIGQFRAIVTDIPGTTRDILSEEVDFAGLGPVEFLDSPGLLDFTLELEMIHRIIQESDFLLFVVDHEVGLGPKEHEIQSLVLKHQKKLKTVLVVNKLSQVQLYQQYDETLADYFSLGFGQVVGVSAKQGENIDVLQTIIQDFARENKLDSDKKIIDADVHLAIVGRPNVGKSTLLNTLAGETVAKVEDFEGTTLDYNVTTINFGQQKMKIYDTMGLQRKSKTHGIEKIAHDKTFTMLRFVKPITILMVDAVEGLTRRDLAALKQMSEMNLPVIIAVNKIDRIPAIKHKALLQKFRQQFGFAPFIPLVGISAAEAQGLQTLLQCVGRVWKNWDLRISTSSLNNLLHKALLVSPPRFPKNKACKLFYISQTDTKPARFLAFVNNSDNANFSYKKWLENAIRKAFPFEGVPFVIEFKSRKHLNEMDKKE
ncbi:MAG TPA: ribosome biogenesis GTPase Der [Candidatus Absconditabacterales bacterium]|nr:ribosome biogenesis GTPase Der [Candidatus Absconditabacterales bacterium]